ncbi:uncharacterized protein LOC129586596 [Paramacrobiotus metropolitanus]|uniref:uncharacterized protein LOC129586596 n=1 Tax=Paramacrobiotus metropolitanus TaxID=2943436 RepID=UPI00244637AD|nr:uncharacterized protein LOC129586596 [Paramacrobiotus metropolitanus]XP_055335896.1 uncharacterized protein LOC129586596 [Paramacrobiotus metropolitanus]
MLLTGSTFLRAFSLVLCTLPSVMPDNLACSALAANYTAALKAIDSQYDMVLGLTCPSTKQNALHAFLCDPDNTTDTLPLFNDFCTFVHSTGQLGMDFSRQCPTTPVNRPIPFAPDVFLAIATLCETGDLAKYIRAVTPCIRKRESSLFRKPRVRPPGSGDPGDEWGFDMMETTEPCRCFPRRFMVNRQFLCRFLQGLLAYASHDTPFVATCGQETLDIFLEMREKALSALNCPEFGDYVRNFDFGIVRYQDGKMFDFDQADSQPWQHKSSVTLHGFQN